MYHMSHSYMAGRKRAARPAHPFRAWITSFYHDPPIEWEHVKPRSPIRYGVSVATWTTVCMIITVQSRFNQQPS